MRWFDGHLDLTYLALHGRDLTKEAATCGGGLQPASVTFSSLRWGGVAAAISTIFVRKRGGQAQGDFCFETGDEAFAAGWRQVELHRAWEREGRVTLRQNVERGTLNDERLQVMLAIEGAACLRTVEDLDAYHDAGVRMVSLAWAEGSRWAGGDQSGGGLSEEGKRLVGRLDARGCVHDVSHLSEEAFWTLMESARGRVVASHSNCRALLPGAKHPERHLSDEQIRALAGRAGGEDWGDSFARFLVPAEELKSRRATAADVVRHMTHVEQVAGRRDVLALGSDMDSGFGTELLPVDVQGPEQLGRLVEALSEAGWRDSEIEGFAWGWGFKF